MSELEIVFGIVALFCAGIAAQQHGEATGWRARFYERDKCDCGGWEEGARFWRNHFDADAQAKTDGKDVA